MLQASYTKSFESPSLPESLTVATECSELVSLFLPKNAAQIIRDHAQHIDSIKFSDQPVVRPIG